MQFLPFLADSAPNPWELYSWQAVVVVSILGLIQFGFGFTKDRRDKRKGQAELGFTIMDAMLENQFASGFLEGLDNINRAEGNFHRRGFETEINDFKTALATGPRSNNPAVEKVQLEFDYFLYYLNRFEISLETKLILFTDIRSPINYYVRLLLPFRISVVAYCQFTSYTKVITFLERFEEWKQDATPQKPTPSA
jgi:hypothetical protein